MTRRGKPDLCVEALIALMAGHTERAISIFVDSVNDDRTAFAWASGYAGAIGAVVPGADDAPLVVEITRVPGWPEDPVLEDLLECAGAFLAATHNGDVQGAYELWEILPFDDRPRLLFTLAKMAAITLAEQMPS